MHTHLKDVCGKRILYCDTPQECDNMTRTLQQLQIRYDAVTCHLKDGRSVPGFRISTAAYIFLATISLVNTN